MILTEKRKEDLSIVETNGQLEGVTFTHANFHRVFLLRDRSDFIQVFMFKLQMRRET